MKHLFLHALKTSLMMSIFLLVSCGGETRPGSTSGNNGNTTGGSTTPSQIDLELAKDNMVGVWSLSPYGPFPLGPKQDVGDMSISTVPQTVSFPDNQAVNRSFRMTISPTTGGKAIRVRLSNAFGTKPVRFENISIARGTGLLPTIQSASKIKLTVEGQTFGVVQPGDVLITDVAAFDFKAREDLAITFHVAGESGAITWHALSFAPQYISPHNSGDVTDDDIGTSFQQISVATFFISGVDAYEPKLKASIVALGDSITDGLYQVLNLRWTDFLASDLVARGEQIGILNQGISGNSITSARGDINGPHALIRFDRDVLSQSGVKGLILFEGTNDLGAGVKAEPIIAGYVELIQRAREANLCVFMGTITPRADVAWLRDRMITQEPERQKINGWIRTTPLIDGVIDFDKAVALPGPLALPNPAFFFADLLHPNPLGFRAMANAIEIDALLTKCDVK